MKEKAKYICEHCGSEVLSKARFCPHCGKFFSAVRCPRCNYTGTNKDFKNGCPKCHYTETPGSENSKESGENTADGLKHKLSKKSKKKISQAFAEHDKKNPSTSGDTPVFVLILSLMVLAGLIAGLVLMLKNQ